MQLIGCLPTGLCLAQAEPLREEAESAPPPPAPQQILSLNPWSPAGLRDWWWGWGRQQGSWLSVGVRGEGLWSP